MRAHPAPCKPDFHMAYLCLRAMEMRVCGYPTVQRVAFDVEVTDLFFGYRSPWRA